MTRQHFFNTRTTQAAALKMERIWLPSPSFNFRATTSSLKEKQMHCFPVGDRRVVCADHSGNCFLVDAEMRRVVMMPHLHKLKSLPLSLFVPSTDAGDHNDGGGSLFVMESAPEPEAGCNGQLSHQFEAFVYRKPTPFYCSKFWHSQLLPPPPFVCDPKYIHNPPKIRSYAVVSGGSHICISVEGSGSYFLNTASYTWSHERSWTLPFHGKVEYVPELKLWFGLSAKDHTLAAADLSNMDSQPQLAVIGGGSHICISAEGAGTYCLDTVSHTWSHEFEWTLPFHGKVEYVPELNLWFGLSAKDGHLAAADLSSMDSRQPQIVGVWKELNLPKERNVTQVPQLVNLGSGRFKVFADSGSDG